VSYDLGAPGLFERDPAKRALAENAELRQRIKSLERRLAAGTAGGGGTGPTGPAGPAGPAGSAYGPSPSSLLKAGWTLHPHVVSSTGAPTAGRCHVARCYIDQDATLSTFWLPVATIVTSGTTASVYGGVFSPAGVLLGKTFNLATTVSTGSAFWKQGVLTAEAGRSLAVVAGAASYVYLGLVVGTVGALTLFRGALGSIFLPNAAAGNPNLYAGATAGTGLTAMPTSFDPTSVSDMQDVAVPLYCMAVS